VLERVSTIPRSSGTFYTRRVIPSHIVVPEISIPVGDDCGYPTSGEISEEGFGYFRGTWWIGHVPVSDARHTVAFEREVVAALDALAGDEQEFEVLATALEDFEPESDVPLVLRDTPVEGLVRPFIGGYSPLGGLEIGVAGLTYALSTVGFRTAASCRAHEGANSWSDCPVVLFGAHKWRAVLLAELVAEAGCGIGQDRDMLKVYAPSIRNLMDLAEAVLAKRVSFRSKLKPSSRSALRAPQSPYQATLGL
jgi:hypothetical protein